LILGVLFLIYLWAKSSLSINELMPILMAASNAFGMSLVVIFLSYGLVAFQNNSGDKDNIKLNLNTISLQLQKSARKNKMLFKNYS
jgi:hypothetical protein